MNFAASYELTHAMQSEMTKQYFLSVHLRRRWLVLPALILASIATFYFDAHFEIGLGYILMTLAAIFAGSWIRAYLDMQVHGENKFNSCQDHRVAFRIDDSEIHFSSERGTSKVDLTRLNRIQESKDFLFLFRNGTPITYLPKKLLNSEVVESIRQTIAKNASSGRQEALISAKP